MKTREEQLAVNVEWVTQYLSAAVIIADGFSGFGRDGWSTTDVVEIAKMLQAERHNAVVRAAVSQGRRGGA